MRSMTVLVLASAAAGCGVTEERLDERLGAERRFAQQERRQFQDEVTARVDATDARLNDALAQLEQAQKDVARDVAAFAQRVGHVEADLATIKTTAIALESLRRDSEGRLAEMKALHDEFNTSVGTLDKKIQISQEKYRDIIRKNIQSLKEQYTYFSNLLRELEQGGGGGGD